MSNGPNFSLKGMAGAAVAALLVCGAGSAEAADIRQCVKNTTSCATDVIELQLVVLNGAAAVLDFASANANCVADIVASNFVTIGISAAMVGMAASGVLKQEGGSYLNYVYGAAARPMVEQISKIAPLPPLKALLTDYGDDAIGAAFSAVTTAIPMPSVGAPNLKMQLNCGDAIAVAGAGMIDDVKRVIGSAKEAVTSCSAAAGCFASVLVDIVKDPGGAAVSVVNAVADEFEKMFQDKGMPFADYFNQHWAPGGSVAGSRVDDVARKTVTLGDTAISSYIDWIYPHCFSYYDSHRLSSKNAHGVCSDMRDGTANSIGGFSGRGGIQLVRWRAQEYQLPKAIADAALLAIKKYDIPANRDLDPAPANLAKFWPKDGSWSYHSIGAIVRKAYGISDGKEMDKWPHQTVGAYAEAAARARAPDPTDAKRGAREAVAAGELQLKDLQARIDANKPGAWQKMVARAQKAKADYDAAYAKEHEDAAPLLAACGPLPVAQSCREGVLQRFEACREERLEALNASSGVSSQNPTGAGPALAQAQKTRNEAPAKYAQCLEGVAQWARASVAKTDFANVPAGALQAVASAVAAPRPAGAGSGVAVGGGRDMAGGETPRANVGALTQRLTETGAPPAPRSPEAPPRRLGMGALPTMSAIPFGGANAAVPPVGGVPPVVAAPPIVMVPPASAIPGAGLPSAAMPTRAATDPAPARTAELNRGAPPAGLVDLVAPVVSAVVPGQAGSGSPAFRPPGGGPVVVQPSIGTAFPPSVAPAAAARPGDAVQANVGIRPINPGSVSAAVTPAAVGSAVPQGLPPGVTAFPRPDPGRPVVVPSPRPDAGTPGLATTVPPSVVAVAPQSVLAPLPPPPPKFDADGYRRNRLTGLRASLAPGCSVKQPCLDALEQLIARRVEDEIAALLQTNARPGDPSAIARVQQEMELKYVGSVRSSYDLAKSLTTAGGVSGPGSTSAVGPISNSVKPPVVDLKNLLPKK